MSYKPIHAWKRKDKLPSKDPQKIIYGTQLQDEFDAISVTFDEVQGGFDEVKDKLESGGYSVEEAPADGDQYGRQQKNGKMAWTKIDSVGSVTWSEISDKPSTYPPSAHNHDGEYLKTETDPVFTSSVAFGITQDDIDSWNAGGSGGASTWDELTGKPTEFPPSTHTHEIEDVNGLQDALDNAGGDSATYTLPVVLRSGAVQLPLALDGKKLAVMTRGGELELPLAA